MKNVTQMNEQEELLKERFGLKHAEGEELSRLQQPEVFNDGYQRDYNVNSKSTLYHSANDLEKDKESIYKPVDIPLNTPHTNYLENVMMNRVPKNSPMYGGPLNNLTSRHKVPNDKFHNILLKNDQ